MDAAVVLFDLGALRDVGQITLCVSGADTAGHAAVVGDGVAQQVAYHAVVQLLRVPGAAQVVIDHPEGVLAVVIVGIDDREGRAVDLLLGAQDGVAGAEGLDAALGHGEAVGDLVHLLIGVADLHGAFLQPRTYGLHKVGPDGLLNNNDSGFKAGLMGIIQRVVQNGFSLAAYGVDLLQTAVTAAHTGGHNHQNRFLRHNFYLLKRICSV